VFQGRKGGKERKKGEIGKSIAFYLPSQTKFIPTFHEENEVALVDDRVFKMADLERKKRFLI
jgi:hypothetical protein